METGEPAAMWASCPTIHINCLIQLCFCNLSCFLAARSFNPDQPGCLKHFWPVLAIERDITCPCRIIEYPGSVQPQCIFLNLVIAAKPGTFRFAPLPKLPLDFLFPMLFNQGVYQGFPF